jgi:hypothetical protein
MGQMPQGGEPRSRRSSDSEGRGVCRALLFDRWKNRPVYPARQARVAIWCSLTRAVLSPKQAFLRLTPIKASGQTSRIGGAADGTMPCPDADRIDQEGFERGEKFAKEKLTNEAKKGGRSAS